VKKIMESWRKYLNEQADWVGFHGKGGRPNNVAPGGRGGGLYQLGCLEDFYNESTGEGSFELPQPDGILDEWQKEGDGGCPQFSHTPIVGRDDVELAVRFLNDRKPTNLVAYSRGGAVAYLAMKDPNLKHRPNVYYVAAAWKKSGIPPAGAHTGGYIIHGTHDVRIPLKDSFELSILTGLPIAIFQRFSHLADILGVGQNPEKADVILTAQQASNLPYDELPQWQGKIQFWKVRPDKTLGTKGQKADEIITIENAQQQWCEKYIGI